MMTFICELYEGLIKTTSCNQSERAPFPVYPDERTQILEWDPFQADTRKSTLAYL